MALTTFLINHHTDNRDTSYSYRDIKTAFMDKYRFLSIDPKSANSGYFFLSFSLSVFPAVQLS